MYSVPFLHKVTVADTQLPGTCEMTGQTKIAVAIHAVLNTDVGCPGLIYPSLKFPP